MNTSDSSKHPVKGVSLRRRSLLSGVAPAALTGWAWPAWAVSAGQAGPAPLPTHSGQLNRVATAWRQKLGDKQHQDHVGVLQIDWAQRRVSIEASHPLPTRAHGLMAEAGGGFLAVDSRPGQVLMRFDAQGQLVQSHAVVQDLPHRTLGGHVTLSADGRWLYAAETDVATGQGWIGVRDVHTLKRVDAWPSGGLDPHQHVLLPNGDLVVANGGIPRDVKGNKQNLPSMDPSLVVLSRRDGSLQGQWRLDDRRLSLRHMAWGTAPAQPADGQQRLLGIGLQAEHEDLATRRAAPALAVWDGQTLSVPTRSELAGGYAGDIAAGPAGGFVFSGQRVGRNALWHPDEPADLLALAELTEPCAMAAWSPDGVAGGVLMGAGLAVARWHPQHAAMVLPVPKGMVLDNHWIVLA